MVDVVTKSNRRKSRDITRAELIDLVMRFRSAFLVVVQGTPCVSAKLRRLADTILAATDFDVEETDHETRTVMGCRDCPACWWDAATGECSPSCQLKVRDLVRATEAAIVPTTAPSWCPLWAGDVVLHLEKCDE
jgi:hypothetical protein